MKKKVLSILLALALCLSLLPTAALADETGTMPAYSGGNGTESDPWLISSVEDLQLLANTINNGDAAAFDADCTDTGDGIPGNYHGYYFKQTTDLDLSDIVNWDPIGYSDSYYFAGHYDGGGHTISNAKSTGKNDDEGFATAGIFGWVAFGSVENLYVENADFKATGQGNYSYVGGVAAVAFAAFIENCTVKNSTLESKRDNNNNCAGGIAGYSTGATFKNCASVSNNIQSMAYGGGFVGENDDDYGVGESKYTDCYAVNCSVAAKTANTGGTSFAGGFIGMIVSDIALTNCYAYKQTLSTEGTSASNAATGVFAAYSFTNGSTYTASINTTNCYYGECTVTTNVGSATEKTSEEFTDGTVANALGTAFAQGKLYPVFASDPADYTAVDAAIAKANALNKDNYKDFSAVEAAVNAVDRNKKIAEQSEVDAMAKAIEDAIAALQYKDADYTAVDAAIEKASALKESDYKDFSAVKAALEAVERGKNITEQSEVDAMAQAIEDAITALQYKNADYTKVDEAIAKANALNKDNYKDFSAVEAAVNAVVRDKNITEQAEVDAMAKAIDDAIAALVEKPSSGGGSSSGGGGGGSSSSSKPSTSTGTTTRPDGTKVQTETRADGTKIQTETKKDGSTVKTTTNPNGSSVTETKAADGSTATVKTDKNGNAEAETKVSGKAVEDAKKNGEAVKAPVEVEASRDSKTAPTVKVELPKGAGETKVEIPVSNVKPGTVAVLVHPDGTEEIVKNSIPTEDGIQLTVDGNATVKIVDNSKGFIDIRDHWAEDAIDFVSARGLVNGMSATIYAPNNSTTRAQLWTILARQNDADLNGGSVWYEKAQLWSKDKGISDGANPNGIINRAQMVTMLWRAVGQPAAGSTAHFIDVPADAYYAQAVSWAIENGITAGVGGGRFDPNATCTRAQIATFLARSMK